jgi:hypothetical protein
MLFAGVGVPTYTNKAGGMPGAPVGICTPQQGSTPVATQRAASTTITV